METDKIFVISALLCMSVYLAMMLYRTASTRRRARHKIIEVKGSGEHPDKIRMFAEAQTAMMKLNLQFSCMMAVLLVVSLSTAAWLFYQ